MNCVLCKRGDEGQICQYCRNIFLPLAENISEFEICLICEMCDQYSFPCRYCAKYVFEFNLGTGNGPKFQNFDDGVKDNKLTLKQILNKLPKTIEQKIIIIEEDDEEISKKKGYCSIQ